MILPTCQHRELVGAVSPLQSSLGLLGGQDRAD